MVSPLLLATTTHSLDDCSLKVSLVESSIILWSLSQLECNSTAANWAHHNPSTDQIFTQRPLPCLPSNSQFLLKKHTPIQRIRETVICFTIKFTIFVQKITHSVRQLGKLSFVVGIKDSMATIRCLPWHQQFDAGIIYTHTLIYLPVSLVARHNSAPIHQQIMSTQHKA